MELSKTEQDYLKAIYEFEMRKEKKLVSLKMLAEHLQVSGATVTEMVKRIEKKDLIVYHSYKGVHLTDIGLNEALFILKAHRVWEYFLLNTLNYQEEDVHREADALEHAVSPRLIERLYAYLGEPKQCPHGREIPQKIFWSEHTKTGTLADFGLGIRAEIIDFSKEFQDYLTTLNITEKPSFIKIVDILADQTYIVELNNGNKLVIPGIFQQDIHVVFYQ